MSKLPFINLTFEDTKTSVDIDDRYIIHDSVVFDYILLNKLKPASNKLSLTITKDCPYIEQIINAKKDIHFIFYLKEDNVKQKLFTGYLTNKFTWSIGDHGESVLNLNVEDVGTRLLKKTWNKSYKYISGTVTEVLNALCKDARITRADTTEININVSRGVKKETKFEDLIRTLLEEVGYTYYFNESGKLALEKLNTTGTPIYTVDKNSLYSKSGRAITVDKEVKQYGKVSVNWKEYTTIKNTLIYEDVSGRDESHPGCNITLMPKSSYPSQDGSPSFVEVKDIGSGKEVVYFSNIKPTVKGIGYGINHEIIVHDDKSLSVLVTNTSSSEAILNVLKCTGDLIVVNAEGTSNDGIDSGETLKVNSEWLHTKEANDAYANFLANYYTYCNHSYRFFSTSDMKLGSICSLKDETYSGLTTKVLLTGKKWKLDGIYEYRGVAIDKFDIANPDSEVIIKPGIPMGPAGPQGPIGNGIEKIVQHYQVSESTIDPPTVWVETIPEFTVIKRYLWSYTSTHYTDGSVDETLPGVIGTLGIDGKAPVNINGTFNTYNFPADNKGLIAPDEYVKMICAVNASQDEVPLTVISTTNLQKSQYYITAKSTGITNIVVDKQHVRASRDSIMLNDSASILVEVHYKDVEGVTGTLSYRINLSKAKEGAKGEDGGQGIPGPAGPDGLTSYLHIAYANSADGKLDFTTDNSKSAGKKYLGQYTDHTSTNSTIYTDYHWSLIKGEQGDVGPKGNSVKNLDTTRDKSWSWWQTYGTVGRTENWISVNNVANLNIGDIGVLTGTVTDRDNINCSIYMNINSISGTTINGTTISMIVGETGETGLTGQYTAFKYYASTSDTTQTGGTWQDNPPSIKGGKYLWMKSQVVPAGGSIDEKKWSTPVLSGTDISVLVSSIDEVDGKTVTNANAISVNSQSIAAQLKRIESAEGTISTHTSEIQANADGIATNARSISTVDGKVSDNATAIQQNANDIALKANQTSLDSTNQNVSSNAAAIKVNANNISAQVTKLNETNTKVSANTTAIQQNATDIALRVTKTDAEKMFDEAAGKTVKNVNPFVAEDSQNAPLFDLELRGETLQVTRPSVVKPIPVNNAKGHLFLSKKNAVPSYSFNGEKVLSSDFWNFQIHGFLRGYIGNDVRITFDIRCDENPTIKSFPVAVYGYQGSGVTLSSQYNLTAVPEWKTHSFKTSIVYRDNHPEYSMGSIAFYTKYKNQLPDKSFVKWHIRNLQITPLVNESIYENYQGKDIWIHDPRSPEKALTLTKWDRIYKENGVWKVDIKGGTVTYTGDASEKWGDYQQEGYWSLYIDNPDLINQNNEEVIIYSNMFKYHRSAWLGVEDYIVSSHPSYRQFNFYLRNNEHDIAKWRQTLAKNPLNITFKLHPSKRVTYDLCDKDQVALNNLCSYKGTTVISSLGGQLDVSYCINEGQAKIVSNQGTLITQNADNIALKANASDVYTKDDVYTKTQADSQIKVSADAITSSVSKTYETKTDAGNTKTALESSIKQNADKIASVVKDVEGNKTTIEQTQNQIAFKVDSTTGEVKTSSGITVGTQNDRGYILLDADDVIAPNTITANKIKANSITGDKIDTDSLYAKDIILGNKLLAGGYAKDVNNPNNEPGLYADRDGVVKLVDAKIKGTIESDTLLTVNSIPNISSSSVQSQYKSFWDHATSNQSLTQYRIKVNNSALPDSTGVHLTSVEKLGSHIVNIGTTYYSYSSDGVNFKLCTIPDGVTLGSYWTTVPPYKQNVHMSAYNRNHMHNYTMIGFGPGTCEGVSGKCSNLYACNYLSNGSTGFKYPINISTDWKDNNQGTAITKNIYFTPLSIFSVGNYYYLGGYINNNTNTKPQGCAVTRLSDSSHEYIYKSAHLFGGLIPINNDLILIYKRVPMGGVWAKPLLSGLPEQKLEGITEITDYLSAGSGGNVNGVPMGVLCDVGNTRPMNGGLFGKSIIVKYVNGNYEYSIKKLPAGRFDYINGKFYSCNERDPRSEFKMVTYRYVTTTFDSFETYNNIGEWTEYDEKWWDTPVVEGPNNKLFSYFIYHHDDAVVLTNYDFRSISQYFSNIKPKLNSSVIQPSAEPLWYTQNVSGTFTTSDGSSKSLQKLLIAPTIIEITATDGSYYKYSPENYLDYPLTIDNLVINKIEGSTEIGNTYPINGRKDCVIGSEANKFKGIWSDTFYGPVTSVKDYQQDNYEIFLSDKKSEGVAQAPLSFVGYKDEAMTQALFTSATDLLLNILILGGKNYKELNSVGDRWGYIMLPFDVMIQWGSTAQTSQNNWKWYTFHKTFTSIPAVAVATGSEKSWLNYSYGFVKGVTTTGFYHGDCDNGYYLYWIAIGRCIV